MNRKWLVISVVVFFVAVIFIIYVAISSGSGFKVTSYEPKGNTPQPLAVIINFNKPVSSKSKGSIKIEPSVNGTTLIKDNSLYFYPKTPFANKQSYKVSVSGYSSLKNVKMGNLSFTFKVDTSLKQPLSQAQQQASVAATDSTQRNPIVSKLPYDGLTFRISAIVNGEVGDSKTWRDFKDNYLIKIETFAYRDPKNLAKYKSDSLRFRQDALNWIIQQGVDPSKDIHVYYVPSDQVLNPATNTSHDE